MEGVGGGTISDSILGSTRHFFLLNLYNFKNIGGARSPCPPTPRSLNKLYFIPIDIYVLVEKFDYAIFDKARNMSGTLRKLLPKVKSTAHRLRKVSNLCLRSIRNG